MVGYISQAVANALKAWEPLSSANVIPVRATDGDSVVVNTPLPAVAIHVLGEAGSDNEGGTAFGGSIRQYFELSLYMMNTLVNYTFSDDGGAQTVLLDMADEIIRCMELSDKLTGIRQNHDFNVQFDRMESDTTYGSGQTLQVPVDVQKVVYRGSVKFNLKDDDYNRYVLLKQVNIDYEDN